MKHSNLPGEAAAAAAIAHIHDGGRRNGKRAAQQVAEASSRLSSTAQLSGEDLARATAAMKELARTSDEATKVRPPETARELRQLKRAVKQARRTRAATPASRIVKPSAREIHTMRVTHWEYPGPDKHGRPRPPRLVTDPWPDGHVLPVVRIHL